ncbi:RNA polymerase sigma factor [Neobacillus sp. MM2021_6]|uniref:RNA polymerase sigma factor n=1 Tax=Bacillaceae TaxID=186817 RepID=UPI001A94C5C9|nr:MULTISPECIES: RNA polymerase sigma factor [Bacillaceae]MBO0959796.1 RNA polymerase sigma factor [Neobacillus sp. MM2021_6]
MVNKIDFSEVYRMYYKRLFHISYSITRDLHLAEDVVQETFIKAMKKVETIEEEKKMGAWLSVIATRTAIDYVRSERKKHATLMEEDMLECLGTEMMQNVEEEVELASFQEQVNAAIATLTTEYQAVLNLKLLHGLKEYEIASVLDIKPSTVKTRIYRARKQLKLLFLKQLTA